MLELAYYSISMLAVCNKDSMKEVTHKSSEQFYCQHLVDIY